MAAGPGVESECIEVRLTLDSAGIEFVGDCADVRLALAGGGVELEGRACRIGDAKTLDRGAFVTGAEDLAVDGLDRAGDYEPERCRLGRLSCKGAAESEQGCCCAGNGGLHGADVGGVVGVRIVVCDVVAGSL